MKLFKGRMNRATYWSCLALMICFIVLFRSPSATGSALGVMFGMSVHRLHDIGRSGKWALPALLVAYAGIILPLLAASTLGSAVGLALALISATIPLLIVAAAAWLGSIPGQAEANRFGPPPGPGLALIKNKPRPQAG